MITRIVLMLAQVQTYPPTPTPLPIATPRITIPEEYSIWAGAPSAIQTWNLSGPLRGTVQGVILIAIIIVGIYLVIRLSKELRTSKDEK